MMKINDILKNHYHDLKKWYSNRIFEKDIKQYKHEDDYQTKQFLLYCINTNTRDYNRIMNCIDRKL